jgi:hypothetical protein
LKERKKDDKINEMAALTLPPSFLPLVVPVPVDLS